MIQFSVKGEPIPQGSMRAMYIPKTKQAIIIPGGSDKAKKLHKAWRKAVKEAAEKCMEENSLVTFDEAVEIFLSFYLTPVVSDPYRTRHATTPDWDKLSRSICDSLTDAKMIKDDGRIWRATVTCRYAEAGMQPGVIVSLVPCGADEAKSREAMKQKAKEARAVASGKAR